MSPSARAGWEPLTATEKPGLTVFQKSTERNGINNKVGQTNILTTWTLLRKIEPSRWGLPGIGYLVRGENRPRLIEVQGSRLVIRIMIMIMLVICCCIWLFVCLSYKSVSVVQCALECVLVIFLNLESGSGEFLQGSSLRKLVLQKFPILDILGSRCGRIGGEKLKSHQSWNCQPRLQNWSKRLIWSLKDQVRHCEISAKRKDSDHHDIIDLTAFNTDGFDVTGQ